MLPTPALAEAVAAEWQAQGDRIRPATMPLTRLANTAIDRVGPERARILAEMVSYAGSDLVCYRAAAPPALVARQARHWDAVVEWAQAALDVHFLVAVGVVHRKQPARALEAMATAFAALGDFEIAALHNIMTLTGSALLALMLARRAIAPDAAWHAAHVDEDFQIEQWGEDEEATQRRAARHKEFLACCRFLELCR
jgi:chaperone required for assembly of F1-ATPase